MSQSTQTMKLESDNFGRSLLAMLAVLTSLSQLPDMATRLDTTSPHARGGPTRKRLLSHKRSQSSTQF